MVAGLRFSWESGRIKEQQPPVWWRVGNVNSERWLVDDHPEKRTQAACSEEPDVWRIREEPRMPTPSTFFGRCCT
jgi:hypothetical protein